MLGSFWYRSQAASVTFVDHLSDTCQHVTLTYTFVVSTTSRVWNAEESFGNAFIGDVINSISVYKNQDKKNERPVHSTLQGRVAYMLVSCGGGLSQTPHFLKGYNLSSVHTPCFLKGYNLPSVHPPCFFRGYNLPSVHPPCFLRGYNLSSVHTPCFLRGYNLPSVHPPCFLWCLPRQECGTLINPLATHLLETSSIV
jgi:hypothetical protein